MDEDRFPKNKATILMVFVLMWLVGWVMLALNANAKDIFW